MQNRPARESNKEREAKGRHIYVNREANGNASKLEELKSSTVPTGQGTTKENGAADDSGAA
jgi:hypothetical protein